MHRDSLSCSCRVAEVRLTACAAQITVVTPANRSTVADQCVQWIDKPTILYSGPEWDSTHIYHFFLDNVVPFFSTAIQTSIFDPEPFWHRYAQSQALAGNITEVGA